MGDDIKGIWHRFQSGLDVTVAVRGHAPEKSLGVRDGFLRYLHDVLQDAPPLTVRIHQVEGKPELPMTDSDSLTAARELVRLTRQEQPETFFVVACEEGLSEVVVEGPSAGRTSAGRTSAGRTSAGRTSAGRTSAGRTVRHLVKSWAVVDLQTGGQPSAYEQAWGCSGGVQIPDSVLGTVSDSPVGFRTGPSPVFPSTRRGQGLVQAITGNLENRRSTTGQAVFYALCSLFYGRLSS